MKNGLGSFSAIAHAVKVLISSSIISAIAYSFCPDIAMTIQTCPDHHLPGCAKSHVPLQVTKFQHQLKPSQVQHDEVVFNCNAHALRTAVFEALGSLLGS